MRCILATLAGPGLATLPAAAQADAAPAQVEIIGTSPLDGLGVDRNLLPYASQTVRRGMLDTAQAETMTDFLARRLAGMQVNDIQGSPLQADLTYRGYRASGLVGASQGLSVYLDGVRINEPFGDIVSWDLVPEFALQSLTVLPGANPSFGLNTLGGAIALSTVDGRSAPGVQAEIGAGSFGRRRVEASVGQRHGDGWHSYLGGTAFEESGWRDRSAGRQALLLAKLGRSLGDTDWSISLLGGRSRLIGNGLLPAATLHSDGSLGPDLYAASRRSIYTAPDPTRNTLGQLVFQLDRQLDADSRLQWLAHLRQTRRDTLNGDVADDPVDPAMNAALNSGATRQTAWGAAVSLARRSGAHQWQIGAALDASRAQFDQSAQAARFDAERVAQPGADPATPSVAVRGHALSLGLYATDTWRLAAATHLTTTLRANHSQLSNQLSTWDDASQQLQPQAAQTFRYASLNPALGLARQLGDALTVFANLARNTRVPTVIELGCADPTQPCRLPVGLQSDPFLRQVRVTSLEAGLRWRPATGQRLELVLFRSDNHDDILFGSLSTSSQLGYFENFARTRHQGLDASWQGRLGRLNLSAAYSLLQASYQAAGTLRLGTRNVTINPGTPMAGLPRHSVKLGADWTLDDRLSLGADLQLTSRRGVLGNEDGLLADDASAPRQLRIAGQGLLHLRLRWQLQDGLALVARLQNALDRRYENYGALGSTVFDAQGRYTGDAVPALFVAPGTPRSLYVGLRLRY
jgi:hypothetical protein